MPLKDISSTASFLIACLSETLAYGIAIVLFILSIKTLLKKRKLGESLNKPLVIAAPLIFLFATIHIFGVEVRTYRAFVNYPGGPAAYFGLITSTEKTITQVGQVGAVILADGMTVYRTFMVWGGNYFVIILPTLTFIGTIVGAAGFITAQHRVSIHTSIFSTTVTKWTESFLASSLVTTAICTFLIMFKLLSVQYKLEKTGIYSSSKSLTSRVMRILVESAALYSLNNLMYSVLYSVKLNPEAWFSGLDAPIASITFSLIIIRVEAVVNAPLTRTAMTYDTTTSSTADHAYGKRMKFKGEREGENIEIGRIPAGRNSLGTDAESEIDSPRSKVMRGGRFVDVERGYAQ